MPETVVTAIRRHYRPIVQLRRVAHGRRSARIRAVVHDASDREELNVRPVDPRNRA